MKYLSIPGQLWQIFQELNSSSFCDAIFEATKVKNSK